MILLSAIKVWLSVQRDGGIWTFLKWTQNHLSLHQHPEVSLDVVVVEALLILQENQCYSLLELGDPVSKWMFSVPDLLQRIWFVHLRLEKWISQFLWENYFLCIESFCVDFRCVHRFQLLNVCDHCVTLPNSPRVQSEVVEETLLILQENLRDFLLELVAAVSRWMFSSLVLQRVWFVHLRLENPFFFGKYHLFRIESFWVDFRCVHRLQLRKVSNQYVTLPDSPRVQSVSEEQSR